MQEFELKMDSNFFGKPFNPGYTRSVILENNDKFEYYKNHKGQLIVRCENIPRNMPLYGITFEEIKE